MLAISELYLLINRQAATRRLEEKISSDLQAKKTTTLLKNTALKQYVNHKQNPLSMLEVFLITNTVKVYLVSVNYVSSTVT